MDVAPDRVAGSVEDDGRGYPEADASGRDGFAADGFAGTGIRSMRERAELLEGVFVLSSAPDSGTRVRASIPLNGSNGVA